MDFAPVDIKNHRKDKDKGPVEVFRTPDADRADKRHGFLRSVTPESEHRIPPFRFRNAVYAYVSFFTITCTGLFCQSFAIKKPGDILAPRGCLQSFLFFGLLKHRSSIFSIFFSRVTAGITILSSSSYSYPFIISAMVIPVSRW